MRHKVYRLSAKLSIMGLEVTDLFILMAAWMFNLQVLGDFVHPRAKFLFAGVATFIILKIWQAVKDKVPDRFGSHIMEWITETEVYSVAPDTQQYPLIVNYAKLKAQTPKPAPVEPTAKPALPEFADKPTSL